MRLVSTIIPAFNAEAYIGETLASALAQTHQDHEIIVVDDGSTDATADLVSSFGERVRLIRQQNAGPAAARNNGARNSNGEWLAFLDADDLWSPMKLNAQLNRSAETGARLIYTNRENIGYTDHVSRYQSDGVDLLEGDVYEDLLLGNFITLSSALIDKNVFLQLEGFCEDRELIAVEDWDLWLRTSACYAVALCSEPLVQYRFHQTGISRNVKSLKSNIINMLNRELASERGKVLGAPTQRKVWASAWEVLGWTASAQNPRSAFQYYTRAWLNDPWNLSRAKQVIKSCLGRA